MARRFRYDDHRQFETHLADFVAAYNFGQRLRTLCDGSPVSEAHNIVAQHLLFARGFIQQGLQRIPCGDNP